MLASGIPLSNLGKCTGRFWLDDRRPIIAMRSYFDGSEGEDDKQHRWLTLAGYMASDAFWATFQPKWEVMLRSRYPIAPWLHMYELLDHKDPFERVNGWTDEKIQSLVMDSLYLLQSLEKTAFRSFVYSIDTTARKQLIDEGYDIPESPIICAHSCFRAAFDWYMAHHDLEGAYVFYDRGEPFFESVRQKWLSHTDASKKVVSGDIWGLLADVHDANMRTTPPIQAADILAWGASRALSERDRPYRYLAEIARKIIPQSSWKMDEAAMRRKYPKKG